MYYKDSFTLDKVHVDKEGHIVICTQPELFAVECTYNTDFNNMLGDATERLYTFYSWGMIEKWTVPEANLTTKMIYMRISDKNHSIL